jgi:glycosyltransferase involved in cell wall biosynthesis
MTQTGIRVVAAVVVRNERAYLGNCLRHLIENDIDFVVVDNESTDGTAQILREPYFAAHLLDYRVLPYAGFFDWEGLMEARQAAVDPVATDWILYVSADEIMHSYNAGETLRAAIARIDAGGYDVIDFNEFVFLPIDLDYVSDREGFQAMRHYYFFEPQRPRLMRARKKSLQVSHVSRGGHVFTGEPFRLAPETFALRHYIFLSQAHAFRKYNERTFSPKELSRGWHGNRHAMPFTRFTFPSLTQLDRLAAPEDRNLSRAHPRKQHYWLWPESDVVTNERREQRN